MKKKWGWGDDSVGKALATYSGPEDFNSDLQNPSKMLDMGAHICNPHTGEAETG